ncbi:MAG: hypothetical protein U1F76_15585 [Candidatus Competibacteraceae bacterium]
MITVPIPAWNAQSIIPPVNAANPTAVDRSPYIVSLTDVVLRFGTTPERCHILDGLLLFRAEFHRLGLVQGFQWLDGSFLEHIEHLENRPPRDVDIVTFVAIPEIFQPDGQGRQLFNHDWVKQHFLVDSYVVELGLPPEELVAWSTYWYSLWSHRRSQIWKGYLQIALAPDEDETARTHLRIDAVMENRP